MGDRPFTKENSLQSLYANDTLIKIITDTLPLYSTDDFNGWRDMKLVSYYYDTSNTLRKISFRDGRAGYYYFQFEGPYLRKAEFDKQAFSTDFTIEDNSYTLSEIEQRIARYPEKKQFYELLKMGKTFFEKFKTLL
jgi:hypothetical protein